MAEVPGGAKCWAGHKYSFIRLSAGSRDTEPSTEGATIKTIGGDTTNLGQMAFLLFLAMPLFSHLCKENILMEL